METIPGSTRKRAEALLQSSKEAVKAAKEEIDDAIGREDVELLQSAFSSLKGTLLCSGLEVEGEEASEFERRAREGNDMEKSAWKLMLEEMECYYE